MKGLKYTSKELFDVSGKNVAIVGSTGILGSVYARALAEAGANVAVCDFDLSRCDALAAEIESEAPGRVKTFEIDLSSEDSVKSWAGKVLGEYGHLDALLNNAAAKTKGFFEPLESFSLDDWKAVVDVNMTGMFLTAREIGPSMAERGSGSIINVSSIYGNVGPDQRIYEGSWYEELGGAINTPLVYSATKGAVLSMTRHLATYWGPRGVRTNTLTPGGVFSGQNDTFLKRYSDHVPLGRMAWDHEMVGAVIYLVSDASAYVNGANLMVDGGWTAW